VAQREKVSISQISYWSQSPSHPSQRRDAAPTRARHKTLGSPSPSLLPLHPPPPTESIRLTARLLLAAPAGPQESQILNTVFSYADLRHELVTLTQNDTPYFISPYYGTTPIHYPSACHDSPTTLPRLPRCICAFSTIQETENTDTDETRSLRHIQYVHTYTDKTHTTHKSLTRPHALTQGQCDTAVHTPLYPTLLLKVGLDTYILWGFFYKTFLGNSLIPARTWNKSTLRGKESTYKYPIPPPGI
jgi:hypothetical protein